MYFAGALPPSRQTRVHRAGTRAAALTNLDTNAPTSLYSRLLTLLAARGNNSDDDLPICNRNVPRPALSVPPIELRKISPNKLQQLALRPPPSDARPPPSFPRPPPTFPRPPPSVPRPALSVPRPVPGVPRPQLLQRSVLNVQRTVFTSQTAVLSRTLLVSSAQRMFVTQTPAPVPMGPVFRSPLNPHAPPFTYPQELQRSSGGGRSFSYQPATSSKSYQGTSGSRPPASGS
ncbi:hypothetical protein RR48_01277 [Papilio machaon]|uniref:Uncharacterized protein n=1 Tax=Papilio machaon TaxID=76193 RepID=A0A0N1PFM3_PAPMA|nr:hypothetical protein RR48_01277 [Papilio machaon]